MAESRIMGSGCLRDEFMPFIHCHHMVLHYTGDPRLGLQLTIAWAQNTKVQRVKVKGNVLSHKLKSMEYKYSSVYPNMFAYDAYTVGLDLVLYRQNIKF